MAGPTFRTASAKTANGTVATSFTASFGAVPTAGDLLIVTTTVSTSVPSPTNFTMPAGWTLIDFSSTVTSALSSATFAKLATAGETNSYLVSWTTTSTAFTWCAGAWSGVDQTTPYDPSIAGQNNGASTTCTAPSISPANPNTTLVHVFCCNASRTLSLLSGFAAFRVSYTGSGNMTYLTDVHITAAGPTGVYSGTINSAPTGSRGVSIALNSPIIIAPSFDFQFKFENMLLPRRALQFDQAYGYPPPDPPHRDWIFEFDNPVIGRRALQFDQTLGVPPPDPPHMDWSRDHTPSVRSKPRPVVEHIFFPTPFTIPIRNSWFTESSLRGRRTDNRWLLDTTSLIPLPVTVANNSMYPHFRRRRR